MSTSAPTIVALIPARSGSKRIPGKNIKPLGGKPLIQWTIEAAWESNVFPRVIVATDDAEITEYCETRLCEVFQRGHSGDGEPDIVWVRQFLERGGDYEAFAILRPTSPFRTPETIRRAVEQFKKGRCSSLRAVEPVTQHPGKMWQLDGRGSMQPLITEWPHADGVREVANRAPWHSQPTQSLPRVYVQNSSLEIAHRWCVDVFDSISGPKVAPFETTGMEGFSIDYPDDWDRAEAHARTILAGV